MFDIPAIAAGLPVGRQAQLLAGAVSPAGARIVVTAPPGSGKTTVVPAIVANALEARDPARPGRVVVTQPRRMAARAAARRLAQLTGTRLGGEVGFTVRGQSRTSGATRVEFVTAGVLVNRLLADPDIAGIGAIILDEVHERDLDTDLAFAMAHDVAELREDLTLAVMSATLDAGAWAGLLGPAARIVDVPGALFDLEVSYAPAPGGAAATHRGHLSRAFAAHLAGLAEKAAGRADGSVLVFVPTRRDVAELLGLVRVPGIETMGLSGAQSAREQDAVLTGGDAPRIIVATSVAESSLTVPGVRAVVDSGLSREPRLDTGRGVQGLVTIRESRASAEQRAGRAARLGPGTAVRCFAADEWAGMAHQAVPQVRVAELSGLVLALACWGDARGASMALPDPLPAAGADRAVALLQQLGALDADERVTDLGRRLARVPVEPRLARALLDGADRIGAQTAARVVAMLAAGDAPADADLVARSRSLTRGDAPGAREWRHESARLASLAHRSAERHAPSPSQPERSPGSGEAGHGGASGERAVGLVTALAHPEWIARRRGDGQSFLTVSGTGADVPPGPLGQHEWLAIGRLSRVEAGPANSSGSLVRAAAPIDEATAVTAGPAVTESTALSWDRGSGRVRGRLERRLGAIVLSSTPCTPRAQEQEAFAVGQLAVQGLGLDAPGLLRWSDAALALRDRLAFVHRVRGGQWPDMSVEALTDRAPAWLAHRLRDCSSTYGIDVADALRELLDWHQLAELDTIAPERLKVPTGSRIRVRYPAAGTGGQPVLSVKLQECFGMQAGPSIAGVPVLMELLSPARRPLALTDDLASFWTNVYPQVRAENRGRYAKHPWPTDPLTAPARRGTTRSGR
ncbi:ATP-dependent helicase HrpB [Propionibacterium australiense]|uniref:RNA helicase n=1 Tax=Propionibacterium australiense TaxID=119981 RepID=A0A8B3FJX4_9ACTN|nr:ATP-dependent helicase HrpB [Propionibacterium australiense]RLP07548.1 ATP-dependent helicase HrpB [Propionibacterium australiense]